MNKYFKRFIVITLCIATVFIYLIGNVVSVSADSSYIGRITTDLNMRSNPTTDNNADGSSNVITEIDSGTLVTVVDGNKISGKGCSSGWLLITHNSSNGYVCSKYVNDATTDTYDRPWNTPKKAIVGGAKWISTGYISRGQFTSYLKKYNVNPNGSNGVNGMFNHQYMDNIGAPASEAYTSYKAYSTNNLFSLPLVFSIPVYTGMADVYNRPGGNKTTINTINNVVDAAFEASLDNEGFPESYKRALRYVHSIHPTWSFKAMHTNVDYTYAVNQEKVVGSIQGNSLYYETGSGSAISSEPGWYRPNFATTAYYMDPRNFLCDEFILQFESLEYSDAYNEDVVQSIIANTFMKGNSDRDNQSYKSIFVEAGKLNNISPVYLASLSRQEVGNNGSVSTKGEPAEYEGSTYVNVYNFYNIGAVSSASNPVRQGIKYASGGYCTDCSDYKYTAIVPSTPSGGDQVVNNSNNSASQSISNLGVTLSSNYLKGFNIGTSIGNLKAMDSSVSFSSDGAIATGTVITFADGSKYTAVVYGDISGDGAINSADLLKMRQYLLGKSGLDGAYLESAHVAGNNTVNSADLLKLRQYLLGTSSISQA